MTENNSESWRSVLSSKPSVTTPEGLLFIGVGTILFVGTATALNSVEPSPEISFLSGILFIMAVDPLRQMLAGREADRAKN